MSERLFAKLLAELGPLIAKLIRQYGLLDHSEDARQSAAIGIHRAVESYDPAKSAFITHVTWQMRGELQSLRHRVRLDQRRSAVSAGATTVSLNALAQRGDAEQIYEIVDESAEARIEQAASDAMASAMLDDLLDRLGAPLQERAIVRDYVFGRVTGTPQDRREAERHRQIVRRTMRNCSKIMR